MQKLRIEITIEIPPDELARIGGILSAVSAFNRETCDEVLEGSATISDVSILKDTEL